MRPARQNKNSHNKHVREVRDLTSQLYGCTSETGGKRGWCMCGKRGARWVVARLQYLKLSLSLPCTCVRLPKTAGSRVCNNSLSFLSSMLYLSGSELL